jgi:hypothetical protein
VTIRVFVSYRRDVSKQLDEHDWTAAEATFRALLDRRGGYRGTKALLALARRRGRPEGKHQPSVEPAATEPASADSAIVRAKLGRLATSNPRAIGRRRAATARDVPIIWTISSIRRKALWTPPQKVYAIRDTPSAGLRLGIGRPLQTRYRASGACFKRGDLRLAFWYGVDLHILYRVVLENHELLKAIRLGGEKPASW